MSGWVGATAAALQLIVDALATHVVASETLHGDDIGVPVLAPGTGQDQDRAAVDSCPCPPAVTTERPELCVDTPGFDRVAFHKELDAEVLAFLRKHLAGVDRP